MSEWFSIEVLNGSTSARPWFDAYADVLSGIAVSYGASDWAWADHAWGFLFEVELPDETVWEAFRSLATVRAALDAVPDPVNGLLVHRGRGGSSGARRPRRPRPLSGSGAVALPLPAAPQIDDALGDARLLPVAGDGPAVHLLPISA